VIKNLQYIILECDVVQTGIDAEAGNHAIDIYIENISGNFRKIHIR
jgi:hypothetical protein